MKIEELNNYINFCSFYKGLEKDEYNIFELELTPLFTKFNTRIKLGTPATIHQLVNGFEQSWRKPSNINKSKFLTLTKLARTYIDNFYTFFSKKKDCHILKIDERYKTKEGITGKLDLLLVSKEGSEIYIYDWHADMSLSDLFRYNGVVSHCAGLAFQSMFGELPGRIRVFRLINGQVITYPFNETNYDFKNILEKHKRGNLRGIKRFTSKCFGCHNQYCRPQIEFKGD